MHRLRLRGMSPAHRVMWSGQEFEADVGDPGQGEDLKHAQNMFLKPQSYVPPVPSGLAGEQRPQDHN